MTRMHFQSVAWALRQSFPEPGTLSSADLGSDYYSGRMNAWETSVLVMADVCAEYNGRFDRGRFLVAAGYTRRPDGSMYPMAAPR